MVVNQLAGEKGDVFWPHVPVEQGLHPLLESSGLADLPPATQGVDAGSLERQLFEKRGAVNKELVLEVFEMRILFFECGETAPISV